MSPKKENSMVEKSVQSKKASPVTKEFEECAQIQEASPTTCNPPHYFELSTSPSSSGSPHITTSSESMQVNNTNVIVDRTEDRFKQFGASIVGNIVDYSSSDEEEKDQELKEEEAPSMKKFYSSSEVATSSVPLTVLVVTPSTSPIQATPIV